MLPTSSCGTRLSPTSIGHTGFTGTSLWIDWERDAYIVLLTNRVHPTRENKAIRASARGFTTRWLRNCEPWSATPRVGSLRVHAFRSVPAFLSIQQRKPDVS